MFAVDEYHVIETLVKNFARSPKQLNALQESDAELIRISADIILAVTTDTICEEIESGLYDDPFHIGWMTVAVNASDLAAVGAVPLGLLLSETFAHDASIEFVKELQRGIGEASKRYGIPVLGGDTNFARCMQMGGTAIGILDHERPMTRAGCKPGDSLYASGPLGDGNAYALQKLSGRRTQPVFIPEPRSNEGRLLVHYASSCIDSSDGLFAAVDTLMRVNRTGFALRFGNETYISNASMELCRSIGIPPWYLLAGPHGEFELVFTIPEGVEASFLLNARAEGWNPIRLGVTTTGTDLLFCDGVGTLRIDMDRVRAVFSRPQYDINAYLNELSLMNLAWRRS